MAHGWFESVAVAQQRARKRLPASVYAALMAGSERGQTREDNIAAFAELGFAPHVAGNAPQRDLSTTVLGQPVSLPVLIAPIRGGRRAGGGGARHGHGSQLVC